MENYKLNQGINTIKDIINKISFNHIGFLSHIEVIKDDFLVYEVDNLNAISEFYENSIVKFKIEKDMTLKIYKHIIVLNDVEGTVVLMNEDSLITCNRMKNAKVINIKGSANNVSGECIILKGNQSL